MDPEDSVKSETDCRICNAFICGVLHITLYSTKCCVIINSNTLCLFNFFYLPNLISNNPLHYLPRCACLESNNDTDNLPVIQIEVRIFADRVVERAHCFYSATKIARFAFQSHPDHFITCLFVSFWNTPKFTDCQKVPYG